jgi:hypothetical protein
MSTPLPTITELFNTIFGANFVDNRQFCTAEQPASAGEAVKQAGLNVAHFRMSDVSSIQRDVTVVYRPRGNKTGPLEVATAIVSKHDQFDRKVGVAIAFDRFVSGKTIHLPPRNVGFSNSSDYQLLKRAFG